MKSRHPLMGSHRPAVKAGCLLALALAASSYAHGSTGPEALLRRAYAMERSLVYAAVVRTRVPSGRGEEVSVARLSHDGGRQRLDYRSPPLAGRTLIADGRSLCWLDPRRRTVTIDPAPARGGWLDLLFRNYRVAVAGPGRVAGRPATILSLAPAHPPGPRRRYWIDDAAGLILRTDSYNADGQLLSSTVIESLDLHARPAPALFRIPAGWRVEKRAAEGTGFGSAAALAAQVGFAPREPGYLPPGFVRDGYYLARTGRGMPAAHLRYTDGVNGLSIFEHPYGPGHGRGAGMGMGRRWRGGRGPGGPGLGGPGAGGPRAGGPRAGGPRAGGPRAGGPGMRGAGAGGPAADIGPAASGADDAPRCVLLEGRSGRSLRVFRPDRVYLLVADLPEAVLNRIAATLP